MKILIVKLSPIESNDSANIRTLGLAKGLIDLNYKVDYLTIPPSNNHIKTINSEVTGLTNIIRTNSNSTYDAVTSKGGRTKRIVVGAMRKLCHAFSLYDYTYSIAKNIDISVLKNTEYDIVISSSDPKSSHIAVKNLIKQGLKCEKWIQYWGDPMSLDITNKSIYPKRYLANIEKKILAACDQIVYVSPFTLKEQRKLFPELVDKMSFIPIPYIDKKLYGQNNNEKYTVGYFGAYHSRVRDILPLYHACLNLKEEINLNIVGDSDLTLEETDNINISPRGNITEYEGNSDLLICLLNKRGTQIPGKIYHTAATDKPILVIIDGDNINEVKEYLNNFDRFILCENNEHDIKVAIKSIKNDRKQFSPAPQFYPETIASSFIKLL